MNKMLSLLGLAKKAGRLAVGNDAVTESIRSGRARLIIISNDAAGNTVRRFFNRKGNLQLIMIPFTKEEIGEAIGYKACAAAAICDRGFTEAFMKMFSAMSAGNPDGDLNKDAKKKDLNYGGTH